MKRNSVVISMVFCTLLQASEKFTPINPAVAPLTAAGQDNSVVIKPLSPLVRPELSEFEQKRKEDQRLHKRTLAKGKSFADPERVEGMVSRAPEGVEHPGAVVYFERPEGQKEDEDGYFIDETLENVSQEDRSESQGSESSDKPSKDGEALSRVLTQMSSGEKAVLERMRKQGLSIPQKSKKAYRVKVEGTKQEHTLDIAHKVTIAVQLMRDPQDELNRQQALSWVDETVAACRAIYYAGVGSLAAVIAYQMMYYHRQCETLNT